MIIYKVNRLIRIVQMNKQNSLSCDNYISTDVGDSLKSYSSKFKQLKQVKNSHQKDILPIKLQRAVTTIQRFWRNRMVLRRKLYTSLSEQMDLQNNLLKFQIQSLNRLHSIYQKDCRMRQNQLKVEASEQIKQKQGQSINLIKRLVGLSMMMQKKRICEQDQRVLFEERNDWVRRNKELNEEKQKFQALLSNQFQQEEQEYRRLIKELNMQLLQATKQRGQLEKQMRQKLVQTCKVNLGL